MRSLLLFIIGFIFPTLALSQNGMRFGYSYNLGNAEETNRVIYIYNSTGNFTQPLDYLKVTKGINFSYFTEFNENSGVEFRWQNRHRELNSLWLDNGEVEMQRDVKFRQNHLGTNVYFGGGGAYFGFGVDIGNWKMWTRRGTTNEIESIEYEKIAVLDELHSVGFLDWLHKTQIAFPLFVGVEGGPIGLRITWQIQAMSMYIDNLDNYLIGRNIESYNELQGKYNNVGIELYLKIGGYK